MGIKSRKGLNTSRYARYNQNCWGEKDSNKIESDAHGSFCWIFNWIKRDLLINSIAESKSKKDKKNNEEFYKVRIL